MKGLSAGLVVLCLSLNVGWAAESKPPVAANQTMHDIQGSKAAQSQTGDAIVADKVDKSTHIGQQTNYQLTPELIAALAKSKQGMSEFERRLWWLGVGVISVFFSIALIAYFQSLFTDSAKQSNGECNSRQRFIHSLQTGIRRDIYRRGVSNFLTFLQRTYGGKMSWSAFNLSLSLAYFYPFFMFTFAYSYLGGRGDFSGFQLFQDKNIWRIVVFPLNIFNAIILFYVVRYGSCFDNWGKYQFSRIGFSIIQSEAVWYILIWFCEAAILYLVGDNKFLWNLILIIILGYLFSSTLIPNISGSLVKNNIAGVFAGSGASAIIGTGAISIIIAVIGVVTTVMAASVIPHAVPIAFIISVILAMISAVIIAISGDYEISLLYLFFFTALPIINAMLDYLSWAVSRFFLEQTLKAPNIIIIALEIFADAILAVVFLLLFCIFLPAIGLGLDEIYKIH